MSRVVASVGTDHHPFGRMLEWMARAAESLDIEVVVQRGATPACEGIQTVDYLPAAELASMMAEADAVVCHGGPGTISLALQNGHRPIVMARDPSLGEHVDDHQMRYVAKLAAAGTIDSVQSYDELLRLLAAPRPRTEGGVSVETAEALSTFTELVDRLVSGTLPKRPLRARFVVRRQP